jgi:LDH2 family malate/lactate/ureidoglycolate dehydrogenase
MDCHNGSGIISTIKTYKKVLEKARETGIAIGVARHGSNLGCGSYYGWIAAEDDVICMVCCNTPASMAPFGGADSLIGTNPIIVGVPAGREYPLVLDISTSGVAMGKIQAYAREGKELPAGWANDIDGNPTTDSRAAYTVLPIAAHKGYGLAVMVDVFSSFLSAASYGTDIGGPRDTKAENTGFCVIVVDPGKFRPIDEFKDEVDQYVRMMKNSRTKTGVSEIFLPGEIEFMKFKQNKSVGFEVGDALQAELLDYVRKFGIAGENDTFESFIGSL